MDENEVKRLRWYCRRGMRELDTVLMGFLERGYHAATPADQLAFKRLLTLPDPDILGLLTGRLGSDDPLIARAVELVIGKRIQ